MGEEKKAPFRFLMHAELSRLSAEEQAAYRALASRELEERQRVIGRQTDAPKD